MGQEYYKLRYKIFIQAKEMLYRNWQERVDLERKVSEMEGRKPNPISPPTLNKILKTALVIERQVRGENKPSQAPTTVPSPAPPSQEATDSGPPQIQDDPPKTS